MPAAPDSQSLFSVLKVYALGDSEDGVVRDMMARQHPGRLSFVWSERMKSFDWFPYYRKNPNESPEFKKAKRTVLDCAHFCLPGVPDVWNSILLTKMSSRPAAVAEASHSAEQKDDEGKRWDALAAACCSR